MTLIRIIDMETTGEKTPEAEVCEVGICDFDLEPRLIHPPRAWLCCVARMPPEVQAVHHISLEECLPCAPFDGADVTHDAISAYAAHNAAFELQFFGAPPPYWICTWKSALRMWPDAPSHSNQALRYWLAAQGLVELDHDTAMPPHRAGPDAYVTAHILRALFEAGATGKEMIGWTREPALLPRCPIGKFRGKPWAEVESGFLGWMLKQADMEADLKWNAQRELNRRGM